MAATTIPNLLDLIVAWAVEQGYGAGIFPRSGGILLRVKVGLQHADFFWISVDGTTISRDPTDQNSTCHPLPNPASPDYFTTLKSIIDNWPS